MNLRVTDREFDTILAALRYGRRRDDDRMPEFEIAKEHGKPLSDVEIDALLREDQLVKYVVVKWWPSTPTAIQPATQRQFTDREEAERVKDDLAESMPGRCFAVLEQSDR